MDVEIKGGPAFTMATLRLAGGEQVRVEAGSMLGMSQGIAIETGMTGGLFRSLTRSLLGGESFFQNTYTAPAQGGSVAVAPPLPGDLFALDLTEPLLVQSGSYVASEMGVDVDTTWGGARGFFSSEGFILLRATGAGKLVLSSYGAIHEMVLGEGERYTLDTGHLVAFSAAIGFQVRAVGGLASTLFSGEGLVVDLTGPGRILLQTRSQDQFLAWLIPKLPSRKDVGGSTH